MRDLWSKLHGRPLHSPTEGRADEQVQETLTTIRDNLSEAEQQQVISSDFTPKALKLASRLPFIRDLVAGYYCIADSRTPAQIKAAILVPLVYFVLPADAIPDIIPAAGFTDDLAVWVAALKLFGSHLSKEHYNSADALLKSEGNDQEKV
jgi:uncharacterized membrane protein YkvA (DUF1232 family)